MKSNIFELTAGTRVISLSSRLVLALIPGTKGIYPNLQGQLRPSNLWQAGLEGSLLGVYGDVLFLIGKMMINQSI